MNRRKALQAVFGLAGATLAAPRAGQAWTVVTLPPDSPIAVDYANRCGGETGHRWMPANRQQLQSDSPSPTDPLLCPLCGCGWQPSRPGL